MKNYHDLLARVMEQGQDQFNTRTGKICRAVVGEQLTYNLADGFPAITTKKLAFKAMKGELLGFFRGYDNAAHFRELGCGIWDDNANKTQAWLSNPYRKGTDNLGRIYGKQWTDWQDRRIAESPGIAESPDERERLIGLGYQQTLHDQAAGQWLLTRSINQLENALAKLLTDPSDRRIIVSGWNVAELDMMALPPCHMDYRFVAFDGPAPKAPKVLHVVMTIRSWDLFLGAPFNIGSTSLFLAIMARLAGMEAGTVTIQATNAHIYEDHYDAVHEQLTRNHFDSPTLLLADQIRPVSIGEISGAFARIEPDDISLDGYQSHSAIKAPMAA